MTSFQILLYFPHGRQKERYFQNRSIIFMAANKENNANFKTCKFILKHPDRIVGSFAPFDRNSKIEGVFSVVVNWNSK